MTDVLTGIIVLLAGGFSLVAAIGVLRFPDALARMHASSKVGTFAGSLALLAAAVHFSDFNVTIRALMCIAFLMLTAPIAAHLIARAAAWRAGKR